MRDLSDQALLDVWEQVEAALAPERPAALLDGLSRHLGVRPGPPAETLPVGRRDRALIDLRSRLFGERVVCAAACPACGERIEVGFDLASLPSTAPARDEVVVLLGGSAIRLRAPTTRDLAGVLEAEAGDRAALLVRRCALDPLPEPLPDAAIAAVSAALEEADPDADIALAIACPACGAEHDAPFDIGACLWDDVARAVRRLLREVHLLATAYGWSEAEIFAVPRRRRREYLMLGSA